MPVLSADAGAPNYAAPPVRIRTVLAVLLLLGLAALCYPRAVAAWRLHGAATSLADYGLCMAGPTGPALLRDSSPEFMTLVRRRLIAAPPDEAVFGHCAAAARELTGSEDVERAHLSRAWDFVEYGGSAAERAKAGSKRERSLRDLQVDVHVVSRLADQAWPFARDGYTRLIRPSLGAREAIHPVPLPRPGIGHGLPVWRSVYRSVTATPRGFVAAFGRGKALSAYRSDDGGVSWRPQSVKSPAVQEIAERCVASGAKYFTLVTDDEDGALLARSLDSGVALSSARLGAASDRVLASACDEHSLLAALQPAKSASLQLVLCRFGATCAPISAPLRAAQQSASFAIDLARVDGVSVIAVAMNGIVRVTSSRDDGRSWTPFAVAFDAEAYPEVRTNVATPTQLLTVGKRVLLYGGSPKPAMTYPLLVSDDFGASFRGISGPPLAAAR